jgi:hypothetical protein
MWDLIFFLRFEIANINRFPFPVQQNALVVLMKQPDDFTIFREIGAFY